MKRIIGTRLRSVLLVLTLVVTALPGCGVKIGKNSEPITVYLWSTELFNSYAQYIQSQLPDVDIQFVVGNNDLDFYQFMSENGALPDIITSRRFALHDAVELNDELMDLSSTEEAGAIYSTYLESFTNADGQIKWLPLCGMADGIVANRALFEKYDISLPTDYDSFVSACQAFEAVGIRGFVADYSYDYTCLELLQGWSIPELISLEGQVWRHSYEDPQDDMWGLDKTMTKALSSWLEAQFPEIDFTFVMGYNTMDFYADLNDRGALLDIITCRRFSLNDAAKLSEFLMDLSQTEVAGTFYDSYLENNREPGGAVRWLPMCAEVDGYIANLDLFEKYQIPLPTNYAEFADVCRRFEELGINGYVNDYVEDYSCMEALQGCAIPELMTMEGTLWRMKYESETPELPVGLDGKVWSRVFDKFQQYLLDTRTEPTDADMNYDPMMPDFQAGKTAIIRGTTIDCEMLIQDGGMNCAMLPYFGESEKDNWLLTYPHCQVAVNREVEQAPEKNAAVQRVLGAMFSQEGQRQLEPSSALLSYSKNVQTELSGAFALVNDCIRRNHLYIRLASTEFFAVSEDVVRKMIRGEYGAAEAYADFDAQLTTQSDSADTKVVTTQKSAYDLAMGEHGSPAASAVVNTAREQWGADVAIAYSSVVAAPVFAGEYTEQQLHWLTANRLRLGQARLTGGELRQLMQWLVDVKEDGSNPIRGRLMPVTSGLEYTVTTDGTGCYTLTRVTRNGRTLDENAEYSVLLLGDLDFMEAAYYCNCPMPENLADKVGTTNLLGHELLASALDGGNQLKKTTDYVTIRSK